MLGARFIYHINTLVVPGGKNGAQRWAGIMLPLNCSVNGRQKSDNLRGEMPDGATLIGPTDKNG